MTEPVRPEPVVRSALVLLTAPVERALVERMLRSLVARVDVAPASCDVAALDLTLYDAVVLAPELLPAVQERVPTRDRPRLVVVEPRAGSGPGETEGGDSGASYTRVTSPVRLAELQAVLAAPGGEPGDPAASDRGWGDAAPPVLDEAHLSSMVEQLGSTALVREVVETYLGYLDHRWGEIQDACRTGDVEVLRTVCHSMKSASALLGARAMAVVCADLEAAARRGVPCLGVGDSPRQGLRDETRAAFESWMERHD